MRNRFLFLTLIPIFVGLAGGILFFPVKLNSGYTCLYHRLFYSHVHSLENSMVLSTGIKNDFVKTNDKSDVLLHFYIRRFGIFWWISLFVFISGLYMFKYFRIKKNQR